MGLFNRLKKDKEVKRAPIFDTTTSIDKSNWQQVFSACLGKVVAIQDACSEQVVKKQNWFVDFTKGTLSFGEQSYPVQFLGSESNRSETWKWGYDNVNNFDESLLKLCKEAKMFGDTWGLEALSIANFQLDDTFNGHNLAIVTCGLTEGKYCYYRGPHDGGAIFMAFSNVPDSVFNPVSLEKFLSLTTHCIQQFAIDHKIFIESFLLWNGTKYEWDNQTIIAHFNHDLHITFEPVEDSFRINAMNTK